MTASSGAAGVRAWLDGLDQAWAVSPLYAPSAVEVINEFCRWFESLPTETQDFIRWECE